MAALGGRCVAVRHFGMSLPQVDEGYVMLELNVKIFADGANKSEILRLYEDPQIKGFTTNPTLMRKAGISDYEAFAKDILTHIKDRPISFEVFSDDFADMERQALKIADWGPNVYVKIPVTNTKGEPSYDLVNRLANRKVQLNVTAILTMEQVREVSGALENHAASYVSVFAGRIADTGIDPVPMMAASVAMCSCFDKQEIIWASPRELLNIFQANAIGCQVITVTPDVLKKLALVGKDLAEFSLDTVKMFRTDALSAGFTL
jgi:transaldolase